MWSKAEKPNVNHDTYAWMQEISIHMLKRTQFQRNQVTFPRTATITKEMTNATQTRNPFLAGEQSKKHGIIMVSARNSETHEKRTTGNQNITFFIEEGIFEVQYRARTTTTRLETNKKPKPKL